MGHFSNYSRVVYHIFLENQNVNEIKKSKICNFKHSIKSFVFCRAPKLKCSKKPIADVHFYTLNSIAFDKYIGKIYTD